jgi:hypothetical protein
MVTFSKGFCFHCSFLLKIKLLRYEPNFSWNTIVNIPSMDCKRLELLDPSRTMPNPPLITSPHPTPPPLWMDTHVAPRKLSPITFCIAISAVKRIRRRYLMFLCKESVPIHHDDLQNYCCNFAFCNSLIKSFSNFTRPSASAYKIRACEPRLIYFLVPLSIECYLAFVAEFQ